MRNAITHNVDDNVSRASLAATPHPPAFADCIRQIQQLNISTTQQKNHTSLSHSIDLSVICDAKKDFIGWNKVKGIRRDYGW